MEIKCKCGAGQDQQHIVQRSGGVQGLDFINVRCVKCGNDQQFHSQDAREVAAIYDASNEPTNGEKENESN